MNRTWRESFIGSGNVSIRLKRETEAARPKPPRVDLVACEGVTDAATPPSSLASLVVDRSAAGILREAGAGRRHTSGDPARRGTRIDRRSRVEFAGRASGDPRTSQRCGVL